MGLIEAIKDAVGILDDAGDYAARAERIMLRVKRTSKTLESEGEKVKRRVEDGGLDDIKWVDQYVRSLQKDGKYISDVLEESLDEVRSLRSRVKRSPEIATKVDADLAKVEKFTAGVLLDYSGVLRKVDELKDVATRMRRANLASGLKTAALSLLGSLIGYLAAGAIGGDRVRDAANSLYRTIGG